MDARLVLPFGVQRLTTSLDDHSGWFRTQRARYSSEASRKLGPQREICLLPICPEQLINSLNTFWSRPGGFLESWDRRAVVSSDDGFRPTYREEP